MRIDALDDERIRTLVASARDAGITMFDHADIYGGDHGCERRWGEAGAVPAGEREQVIVQSKVGIRDGRYDSSREHILASVDESLAALRTDYLDVLLIHRPDALAEPDEIAAAFDTLHDAGKVRRFGVSNHTTGQLELLRASVRQPLIANQLQLSIAHAPLVAQGVAANIAGLDQSADRDGAVLDHCRRTGVTVQAWSPLQKPGWTGTFVGDRENYADLNDVLDRLAADYGVTPAAIAIAWIARHPARMQIVLGTTDPGRVREGIDGANLQLTREQWYELFTAAGHELP